MAKMMPVRRSEISHMSRSSRSPRPPAFGHTIVKRSNLVPRNIFTTVESLFALAFPHTSKGSLPKTVCVVLLDISVLSLLICDAISEQGFNKLF